MSFSPLTRSEVEHCYKHRGGEIPRDHLLATFDEMDALRADLADAKAHAEHEREHAALSERETLRVAADLARERELRLREEAARLVAVHDENEARAELALALAAAKDSADARDAMAVENVEMRAALGMSEPWPVTDMLDSLATAAVHLMQDHNCDAHGWEVVAGNIGRVRVAVTRLRAVLAAPSSSAVQVERMKAEARAEAVDLYRRRRVIHRGTERGREVVWFDTPEDWLAEHDARVREDERAKVVEECAKAVEDTEVVGYADRDQPSQVWHDNGEATLRSVAARVRSLLATAATTETK